MLKQGLFKDYLASNIDDIAIFVTKEASIVDETASLVNILALIILLKDRLTTRVHLNVSNHSVDVEASEGEDLRELAVLQVGL